MNLLVSKYTVLFLLSILMFVLGLELFPVDARKTVPIFGDNNIVSIIGNLAVDYGLRLGLLAIFFPIGAIAAFGNSDEGKESLHLVLILAIAISLPKSTYAPIVFLPLFAYYSVLGFLRVLEKATEAVLLLLVFVSALFGVGYDILITKLPFYDIFLSASLILVGGISILVVLLARKGRVLILLNKNRVIATSIATMMVFSIITMDGLIAQKQYGYISHDEYNIINTLDTKNNTGIVFCFDSVIARRLQAYGHPAVPSNNQDYALYMGWIDADEIMSNITITSNIQRLVRLKFFEYSQISPEEKLWQTLIVLELWNNTQLQLAWELGLRYIVVEKIGLSFGDTFYGGYKNRHSQLLHSAAIVCPFIYDGEEIALLRLPEPRGQ